MLKRILKKTINKLHRFYLWKTYFYKFIKLKKFNSSSIRLNNMQTFTLLNLFFLEKNKFRNLKKKLKKILFKKKVLLFHKKTMFIKNINYFYFLQKWDFLPRIGSTWFLRWTFKYLPKRFFKVKLWKINNYIYRNKVKKYDPKVDRREFFTLARDAVFSKISTTWKNFFFI